MSELSVLERGCWRPIFTPLGKKSLFEEIHTTPEQERIHEGKTGVRCASIGYSTGRVIIAVYMPRLDNALILGLKGGVIVKDVRQTLEFAGRYDSIIVNRKVIVKHKRGIWHIDHVNWNSKIA